MHTSRRRALAALALSSAGVAFVWLLKRESTEPEEAAAPAPSAEPSPAARTSYGAPARPMPSLQAPEQLATADAAPHAALEAPDERYPSPYAEHGPHEEKRLLELAVEHQEAMLRHAEDGLNTLDEQGENSDEANLEFERQLRAVEEGRAQTEAFKQRIRQLAPPNR